VTELFAIVRLVNAALLVILLAGLVLGWWRARAERLNPHALATFAIAAALLYGTAEALWSSSPTGSRAIVLLAALAIANVCVYIPLLNRPTKEPPK
jgi:hypothetical protein